MKLQGLHHITMITGEAQRNAEFYADVLGLRLVKKTVNFDQPEAYHLYFGDERGSPGSILTWFEFPGAARGRAGDGMIHTIQLGVGSEAALAFWEQRLKEQGYRAERVESAAGSTIRGPALSFDDYDGLHFELVRAPDPEDLVAPDPEGLVAPGPEGAVGNPPLRAEHPEIPAEHAIVGIEGARAYSAYTLVEEKVLTETLGFSHESGGEYRLQGEARHFQWAYDPAPDAHGIQGAGTVHHIAWAARDEDHLAWQQRVREAGGYVTDVRDRDYFKSIYFQEPRGVLFEIATLSPGFAVDEDPEHLGEELRLPKMHAHLREHLEHTLRPVLNPRSARRAPASS